MCRGCYSRKCSDTKRMKKARNATRPHSKTDEAARKRAPNDDSIIASFPRITKRDSQRFVRDEGRHMDADFKCTHSKSRGTTTLATRNISKGTEYTCSSLRIYRAERNSSAALNHNDIQLQEIEIASMGLRKSENEILLIGPCHQPASETSNEIMFASERCETEEQSNAQRSVKWDEQNRHPTVQLSVTKQIKRGQKLSFT